MMLLNYGLWALIQGVKKDYIIIFFLIFTLLVFYFKWSNGLFIQKLFMNRQGDFYCIFLIN